MSAMLAFSMWCSAPNVPLLALGVMSRRAAWTMYTHIMHLLYLYTVQVNAHCSLE